VAVEDDSGLKGPSEEGNADRELVHEEDVEGLEAGDGLPRGRKPRSEREQEGEGEVELTKDGEDDVKRLEDRTRKCRSENVGFERAYGRKEKRVSSEKKKGGREGKKSSSPSLVSSKHLVGSCREVKSSTE